MPNAAHEPPVEVRFGSCWDEVPEGWPRMAKTSQVGDMANLIVVQRRIPDILTLLVERYLKSDGTNNSIARSPILSSPCENVKF